MTISDEKAALRAEILARRAAIGPELRARFAEDLATAGAAIVRRCGTASPSPVATAYLPIRGEADTGPLLVTLAAAAVRTTLPVMVAPAEPLRFLAWAPGDPLRRARFGVSEPRPDAAELVPDVLFVPLAAFDARGLRLGYGAGFYDATLAALRRSRSILAVGVAFSVQEVARVPAEPHDAPLDAVLTEHGLRLFET